MQPISNDEFTRLCNEQAAAIKAYTENQCAATIDAVRAADLAVQRARQERVPEGA
jgi:hypothetical protein